VMTRLRSTPQTASPERSGYCAGGQLLLVLTVH
jgi:hypothetical protein